MKKILVLVFSNLKTDARVARQVQWASRLGAVTVVCFDADAIPGVEVIRIQQTKLTLLRKGMLGLALLTRNHSLAYNLFHAYQDLVPRLKDRNFDLIMANDIDTLPLAFQLRGNSKIIFDAHEYAPRHFENNPVWRIFFQPFHVALCKKYIPQTDGMITVGKGLAGEYARNFGVSPVVIMNAAPYHALEPSTPKPGLIRLVHHGIVNRSRNIELMIEMFQYLDNRFTLDLYLMLSDYASPKTRAYLDALKAKIRDERRISILPPIPRNQIVSTLHSYDMGVFLIPPVNFNYANTLPNKLFDFIQARLGVAIGPTPEMAEIVTTFGNGIVSEDFSARSLAEKLTGMTEENILRFKENSGKAAALLNAEQSEILFRDLVGRVTTGENP